MKKQQKYLLANKLEFLKLAFIISKYRLSGKKPPKKLIEKAQIAIFLDNYSIEEWNDPAASCRVSGLAYSNNLSCLREVLG